MIDKRSGSINTSVINRANLADLVPYLSKVPPRGRIAAELPLVAAPPVPPAKTTSTLLGGFRSVAPKLAAAASRCNATGAIPLVYTLRDTIADAEQAVGVYVAYRPQRLIFHDAADHPTQLVESAAMASVALPAPNYVPQLPATVIRDRVLSRAQLETLVHALDATSSDLPGRYRVPERGLELVPDAEGAIYRRGFFLGDGTGAGKGRQLASILMDQWLRGNRRHLWVSESNALIEDARRDWQALGGIALDIQPLSKIKPEARIRQSDGTLLIVPEGVVGVAHCWPFAVTAAAGQLHGINPKPDDTLAAFAASFSLADTDIAAAVELASALGFAIDPAVSDLLTRVG